MTAVLHIHLFGGLNLSQDGTPLTGFISSKAPALLAYLAVTGRPHQRDTLAALFWGEMADADAKNNLRQTLSNLRKLLEPYLLITRESVQFDTAVPHTLDTAQFEAHLQNGRAATTHRFDHLAQAAALYHGDFLAGFYVRDAPDFEEWMLAQRVRYRELALHTLHTLTEHHLSRGEYGRAIDSATRLLALDAWREEAHRQLMLAQLRSGQRSAALAQYETCRRLLEAELGVSPSAETIALYKRIRANDQTPQHNLPPQPTPFVGRAEELARLEVMLQQPETRLITLVGTGGMGKTRLALQAAERAHRRGLFLHGVYFVPLAEVDSALLLATAVAQAIGCQFSGRQEPIVQLLAHVQQQELLLVMDNFEHLLAETDGLVRLLQHAPGLKLLLTSRETLNIQWEWPFPVEGLTVPAADDEYVADCTAVQLFTSRARASQPHFSLTPETLAPIVHICQMVDGMPLALELAAAASRHYTCAEIAAAIAQNLDFLTSSYRDTPPRQRSLRAVFDYSWALLSPPEQELMAALSIFSGSFSQEAARQVAHARPPLLAALVDKSLVGRMGDGRYHLHHTLRQYAAEQLPLARQETLRQQHAAYFAAWLQQQEAGLFAPAQTAIFQHLIADHDNIRAAWQTALTDLQLDWLTQGLTTLRTFYNIQSRFQEGAEWLADTAVSLESAARQTPDPLHPLHQLLGKVLTRRASFCAWLGHRAEADALFQQAQPLARRFDDAAETGFLLLNRGYLTVVTGNYETAGQQFQESLDNYRRAGDERGMADALSALGGLNNMTGDWVKARQYLEESVAISRRLQDEDRLRSSLTNLGNVHYLTGNHAQARRFYEEVLPLCQKVGDRASEAIIFSNLGTLAQEAGDYETAEQQLQRGLQLFQEAHHLPAVIQCSTNLAAVYREKGQLNQAQQTLHEALTQAVSQEYDSLIPLVVYEIGLFYQAIGQRERALPLLLWMSQHPAAQAENRLKAEALLAEAWTQMPAERVTAVQQTSQTITPQTVLTHLTALTLPAAGGPASSQATVVIPSLAAVSAPPPDNERFTFQGLIARGGMGEVYRARDNQTGQIVAVKRLLPHLIAPDSETLSPEAITRFQREADVLRRLNHPNIVQIITTLETAGQMMIVMEYVAGGSLRDRLATGEPLSPPQVVDIALELADALARAHHLHIIHRDLKPENVLLAADGAPRLSDFGIAGLGQSGSHLTQQGATLGTFAYMSPEACRGETLAAQTDIWSFGVLLYEMLAGQNPFAREHVGATVTAVLHHTPPFIQDVCPDAPLALSQLLEQMLTKEARQRLGSMRQAAAILEQIRVDAV